MQTDTTADDATQATATEGLAQLLDELVEHFPAPRAPKLGPVAEADMAIDLVVDAGNDLAIATYRETMLYDGRALQKSAAIQRLMAIENPETKKQHTASSAEKIVEADADYLRYRDEERASVVTRIQAEAGLAAAKLRARLAVVMAEASL